ncbi:MAG: arylsulfatase [Limisphaerales bacterium]
MNHKRFLSAPRLPATLILGLFLVSFAFMPVSSRAANTPNIIFILADDLGYGQLSCYGEKKYQTPNIDRLATEGIKFTQAYAGSTVCAPSRSTLMTGLHTGHTPVRNNGGGKFLSDKDVTVAEVLKQGGYVNGMFGKWGLGVETTPGAPWKQGFDEFFGYLHQVHAHFYYPYWMWGTDTKVFFPENEGGKHARYSHDEIQKHALDFIRRNKDKKFFCYIPYTVPHVELTVPEDSLKKYRGKFAPETPLPDNRAGYLGAEEPYATFAAMVDRLDGSVGEIMALLKDLNIDDNTIVFFSGDNGPQAGHWQRVADFFNGAGGLRGYKSDFYEGGIRVPLIARWPGKIKPGSVSDRLCAFYDFLPTAADLAGVKPPVAVDGISLVPTLFGKKQKEHEYLYFEMPTMKGDHRTGAVRTGDWKLVKTKAADDAKLELYNLKTDPVEQHDIADAHPEIMSKMKKILVEAHTPERKFAPEKPSVGIKDYVR